MSGLVVNEGDRFHGFGVVQGGGDEALLVAHFTTVPVAMQKDVVSAGVAEDIDAGVTGDVFGAVAPEDNFFLQVEHAHADLQAIEDVAVGIGIAKGWHVGAGILLVCSSAENGLGFRGENRESCYLKSGEKAVG
ncbi:MAG: hypothetical protein WA654_00410 [Candidatus Sulfotelmatobacter sp.]